MEVLITPNAVKQIKKLPKVPQIAIYQKLKRTRLAPDIKSTKLSGYKNIFRIRVGNYRVVYEIVDKKVYVFLVGHRKDVYKILDRLFR